MKPMIGLMRKRAKAGMTIPAAPRTTSASLKPDVLKSPWVIPALEQDRANLSPVRDGPGRHHFRFQSHFLSGSGWRHDVRPGSHHRRRRAGRDDGRAAVRPRRLQRAGAGEARRLLSRFPRRYGPPIDDGDPRSIGDAEAVPEATA